MTGRALLKLALLILCAAPWPAALGQPPPDSFAPQPTIRVDVNVVNVGVTVTDTWGNLVKGLRAHDFRVYDNGVQQPIRGFLAIDEPAQLVLMMESGPAALFVKNSQQQLADRLIGTLAERDRVAIVSYSRKPGLLLDFTANKSEARAMLLSGNYMSGYAELNLGASVAAAIEWLSTIPGKKTIVLFSSGVDTSRQADWVRLERDTAASDVRILAISTAGEIRKPQKRGKLSGDEREQRRYVKREFAQADRVLRFLADATGGRAYFPRNAKDTERAYSEIAGYVSHEYSLAFAPPSQDGMVHSLRVEVKGLGRRVDHRKAYLAPPPTPAK